MDAKTRAQIQRYGPFETAGAYAWASEISAQLERDDKISLEVNRLVEYADLAAEVRESIQDRLGISLRKHKVSERNVRRLLGSDRSDIKDQLIKMVRLCKKKANIADLIKIAVYWGDRSRQQIAMDYFGFAEELDAETE